MENPTVTITGISGYLGSQICLLFLKDGSYKVRGTVRSVNNPKKIQPLKDAFGEYFSQLELVEADLMNEQSLDKAIEGSTYVVHTASPFPLANPKHEDEVIKPAVDGTLYAMKACRKHKVKRIVITASLLTMTEEKNPTMYSKSKKLADKASMDFVAALPADEKIELVTIHPGFILGPNLNSASFTSGDFIKKVMLKEFPKLPRVQLGCVDVREVAQAHLQALKVPEADGKKFQLCENAYWITDIGECLKELYGNQGYDPAHQQVSKCLLGCAGIFDGEAKSMHQMWGVQMGFDNSISKSILGINYRSQKETLKDMVDALIATGYIPDKRGGKK